MRGGRGLYVCKECLADAVTVLSVRGLTKLSRWCQTWLWHGFRKDTGGACKLGS